jgi:hypothetical protein
MLLLHECRQLAATSVPLLRLQPWQSSDFFEDVESGFVVVNDIDWWWSWIWIRNWKNLRRAEGEVALLQIAKTPSMVNYIGNFESGFRSSAWLLPGIPKAATECRVGCQSYCSCKALLRVVEKHR